MLYRFSDFKPERTRRSIFVRTDLHERLRVCVIEGERERESDRLCGRRQLCYLLGEPGRAKGHY